MYSEALRKRIWSICDQQRTDQLRINEGFPVRSLAQQRKLIESLG